MAAVFVAFGTWYVLSSRASTMPEVGVESHLGWADMADPAKQVKALDLIAAAHLQWVRIDVGWSTMEKMGKGTAQESTGGAWYVKQIDSAVNLAKARHLKVLLTLTGSPDWSHPSNKGPKYFPNNLQDYADFAGWYAGYMGNRVDAWEIWNEPNLSEFLTPLDPVRYTQMLQKSYTAIKKTSPNVIVMNGAPSYNDTGWITNLYNNGMHGYSDVIGVHPYQSPADLTPEAPDDGSIYRISHTKTLHDIMVAHGDGAKNVWFTEYGWSSHANTGSEAGYLKGVTEQQQADYFVRSVKYVQANFPYVTVMMWYNDRNTTDSTTQSNNRGLLNSDFSVKPVYTAIKNYLASLGATPTSTPTPTPKPTTSTAPTPTPTPVSTVTHTLFTITDPAITESSGVTYSGGVYWTHNDNNLAYFYAVGNTGQVLAKYSTPGIAGIATSGDWEDVDKGTDEQGRPSLFFGNIGDNGSSRAEIAVVRVTQPQPDMTKTGVVGTAANAVNYRFKYPDGARDAESLLVQPGTNRIYIISKSAPGGGGGRVYQAPANPSTSALNTLTYIGNVTITGGTAAAFSSDGKRMVVRQYLNGAMYTVNNNDLAAAIKTTPVAFTLPSQRQGEAIAWGPNDSTFILTSEGVSQPVISMGVPGGYSSTPATPVPTPTPVSTPTPTSTPAPTVSATPTPGMGSAAQTFDAVADAYVQGNNTASGTSSELIVKNSPDSSLSRKSYVKFDLTNSGLTSVAKAKVRLYATTVDAATSVTASRVSNDGWSEGAITWATAPAAGAVLATTNVTASGTYYEWDVTDYVNFNFGDNKIISLVFDDPAASDKRVIFASREAAANRPQLVLTPNVVTTVVPSAPTGVSATAISATQVGVNWVKPTTGTADHYLVLRNGVVIATSVAPSYTDNAVLPGTNYSYSVRAVNSGGQESATSGVSTATTPGLATPDTAAPSAPGSLVASLVSATQANLSWTAATDNVGVAGYRVYRDGVLVATVTGTSYGDATLLASGKSYSFTVKAVDASGNESVASNVATVTTGPLPTPSPTPTPVVKAPSAATPCAVATSAPTTYDHVIVIFMENHTYSNVIGTATAPYMTNLARQCGTATAYASVGSPSLPNYLGFVSGSTQGVIDDNDPSAHTFTASNIFRQVRAAGKTEKSYQESMTSNCQLTSSGTYAVRHNPATYFNGGSDRTACQSNDVPMGTVSAGNLVNDLNNNKLPNFSFLTPNLCNDTHDCSTATGDTWLSQWVPKILDSPAYRSGRTAVLITYDEYTSMPTMWVAPSVRTGATSTVKYNHYSLLRTVEEMLGVNSYLGGAAAAPSLRTPFNM